MKYNGLRQIRDTKLLIRTAQALAKFGQKSEAPAAILRLAVIALRTSFTISYLHKTLNHSHFHSKIPKTYTRNLHAYRHVTLRQLYTRNNLNCQLDATR